MTKALFFDTGPIITLVMSRLDWILPQLKKKFNAPFYITPAVRRELVERPLTIRRFQFEALQAMKLIRDGVLEVYAEVPQKKVKQLISLANSSFSLHKKTMDIMQAGEIESIASAASLQASALVIDERTLRLLIEDSKSLKSLLEHRFHGTMSVNQDRLRQFHSNIPKVPIIRSIELMAVAFKHGLLDAYLPKQRGSKELLLNSILWAAKYNGCAVTQHEIEEIKQTILK